MEKTIDELIAEFGKIGRYREKASPFHCDVNCRLFMGHLGNHLLNAADYHSSDRGFGMKSLNTINKTWVLSRLVIEMKEMPMRYDNFFVETWVASAMRFFTKRDFHIQAEDGRTLGYGRSIWALIDTETRQPTNIFDIRDGELSRWIETEKECPIAPPGRVRMSNDAQKVAQHRAAYNDVDVNGHVNSVKYIEHVLDLFPIENFKDKMLSHFEIAYVAESYYGDMLNFYMEQTGNDEYEVRISKVTADGTETECCRSMLRFE